MALPAKEIIRKTMGAIVFAFGLWMFSYFIEATFYTDKWKEDPTMVYGTLAMCYLLWTGYRGMFRKPPPPAPPIDLKTVIPPGQQNKGSRHGQ